MRQCVDFICKRGRHSEFVDDLRRVHGLSVTLARLKSNDLARAVKIADLKHNSDLSRIKNPSPKDFVRVEKYQAALEILRDGAADG